jgi:hypothetical protein
MNQARAAENPVRSWVVGADICAKAALVVLLLLAMLYPESGNMEDKAAGLRAVAYPALSFALPALWFTLWRDRTPFPWLADLAITVTCFTDVLGNRLDLYDTVTWFDDWMHFMNNGLLALAVLLLTMAHTATRARLVERSLAFGATAAIGWEVGEYFAFISESTERQFAYADTLGDLALGTGGSVAAALALHRAWRGGALAGAEPLPTSVRLAERDAAATGF